MPTRQFNGHEIMFLTGNDNDPSRVVASRKLGRGHDGYERDEVVVKHPDGKFYQFEFKYDDEHGIYPCQEDPDEEVSAIEVVPVVTITTTYKPKD